MQNDYPMLQKLVSKDFTDAMVRIGLIVFLAFFCARVFAPFTNLMLWALILAVTLYPLNQRLAKALKGRQGLASTVLVLAGILLIALPITLLGGSFARHLHKAHNAFENNTITIQQPSPEVAEWPLIGNRIYKSWGKAANNMPAFVNENKEQLKKVSGKLLAAAASTAGSMLLLVGAFIVAGIMMAYGEAGSESILNICNRLSDKERGPRLQHLCTATIRSVATGVLGVAFIQALLVGVGFFLSDVPVPGLLTVIVLVVGIFQVPALIVSLPVIIYLWAAGDASTVSNIFFTVYLFIAGMSDNFLKPFLLGRGVNAPMPVILLGAIGGAVASGFIGMFLGAVMLAVGYKVFMNWVDAGKESAPDTAVPAEAEQS